MSKAYYNEIDQTACAWLQTLMDQGLIMRGKIDNRSIHDVTPDDLSGFVRVGFFAGVGGWELALQLAGWPEDRPVWHGSCPCQPFSVAGKGLGAADERHLWPVFAELIRQCRPPTICGEQVASADGRQWLSGVFADLEAMGYSRAGADLCAAGVGAPHIRQRLYWVGRLAHPMRSGRAERGAGSGVGQAAGGGGSDGMADTAGARRDREIGRTEGDPRNEARVLLSGADGGDGGLADTHSRECGGVADGEGRQRHGAEAGRIESDREPERGVTAGGLAHRLGTRLEGHTGHGDPCREPGRIGADAAGSAAEGGAVGGLDDAGEQRCDGEHPLLRGVQSGRQPSQVSEVAGSGFVGGLGDTGRQRDERGGDAEDLGCAAGAQQGQTQQRQRSGDASGGAEPNHWSDAVWLPCRDGKHRRVSSQCFFQRVVDGFSADLGPCWDHGLTEDEASNIVQASAGFPLASKIPHRAGLLKGLGNAICPQLAAAFITAWMDVSEDFTNHHTAS